MTSGPAFLGELRDSLLIEVLALLEADPAVEGVALIGSLGRGEADNWSDIDLLLLTGDDFIRRFMDEPSVSSWARADLLADGRHNSPRGATSVGATHLRSGFPVQVDLHVHPVTPVGPRQMPTDKTSDEARQIHLSYVPVAGKYIARRSPRATEMIRWLSQQAGFDNQDPTVQLQALRRTAAHLASPAWPGLSDAVSAYLDLLLPVN